MTLVLLSSWVTKSLRGPGIYHDGPFKMVMSLGGVYAPFRPNRAWLAPSRIAWLPALASNAGKPPISGVPQGLIGPVHQTGIPYTHEAFQYDKRSNSGDHGGAASAIRKIRIGRVRCEPSGIRCRAKPRGRAGSNKC